MKYGSEKEAFISNVWLGHMYDLEGNRSEALEYYNKAMEAWGGKPYMHSQYNMTVDKSWVEQRLEAPFAREEKLTWN